MLGREEVTASPLTITAAKWVDISPQRPKCPPRDGSVLWLRQRLKQTKTRGPAKVEGTTKAREAIAGQRASDELFGGSVMCTTWGVPARDFQEPIPRERLLCHKRSVKP